MSCGLTPGHELEEQTAEDAENRKRKTSVNLSMRVSAFSAVINPPDF